MKKKKKIFLILTKFLHCKANGTDHFLYPSPTLVREEYMERGFQEKDKMVQKRYRRRREWIKRKEGVEIQDPRMKVNLQ